MRPSPLKSAAAIEVHQPLPAAAKPARSLQSSKPWPRLLWKYFTPPHSRVSSRSGHPSPSTSLQRAPVTMPTLRRPGARASVTSSKRPPRFAQRALSGGSGYCPGTTRPPRNSPRRPLRSKSAAATAPTLTGNAGSAPGGAAQGRPGRCSGTAAAGIPGSRHQGCFRPW